MVADRENGRLITMATAKLSHVVSVIENFTALGSRLFAVAAPATTPGGTVCMRACVHACVCVCVCVLCVCVGGSTYECTHIVTLVAGAAFVGCPCAHNGAPFMWAFLP